MIITIPFDFADDVIFKVCRREGHMIGAYAKVSDGKLPRIRYKVRHVIPYGGREWSKWVGERTLERGSI
jgi:hypothetical protein